MAEPVALRPPAGAGRLLALVRAGRATTRQALTEQSGLARSTVAHRLEQLVAAGLLVEAGTAASTGGRRPAAFAFNREAGVVLVADLGATSGRFACCDLGARVLADERRDLDIGAGPGPVLRLVRARLAAVLRAAGRPPEAVLGVAVGVPGPVEVAAGRVVSPPIMTGWDELDIRDALALPYPGPVLVDNDVNLMALGEHRERRGGKPHMLFVKAGTGIGAGIVAAGQLHRGAQGAAGDIGHIRGPGLDRLCRCGMTGCVEASAGGWALARDLRARGHDVEDTAGVVRLVRAHDPDALDLLQRSARVLGAAVADAVSFFNPSTVVLGGDLAHADPRLLAGVREVVYARSLALATRSLRFELSALGERVGVIGGAHLVIEDRLAPDAVDRMLEVRAGAA
jgi:predicted NBD/HSP70 family sugar kinase